MSKLYRVIAIVLIHVGTWLAYPGLLLNQWANRLAEKAEELRMREEVK